MMGYMKAIAAGAGALLLSPLTGCTADAPAATPAQSQSSSANLATEDGPTERERLLDPLTFTFVLGTPHGDRLPSRIRVENRSGDTFTDPGCRVASNYSFGVVRAAEPGATLTGRVMTRCGGKRDLPDGFSETFRGPAFILRDLPPGDYLAVIDYGNARSERLSEEFTIDSP